jgi:hypothetical protein
MEVIMNDSGAKYSCDGSTHDADLALRFAEHAVAAAASPEDAMLLLLHAAAALSAYRYRPIENALRGFDFACETMLERFVNLVGDGYEI